MQRYTFIMRVFLFGLVRFPYLAFVPGFGLFLVPLITLLQLNLKVHAAKTYLMYVMHFYSRRNNWLSQPLNLAALVTPEPKTFVHI